MTEEQSTKAEQLVHIDVHTIEDPPVILHPDTSLQELKELADSIKRQGLLEPITVREKDGHYQLINGHNRVRAARQFGIPTLPARILDLDDHKSLLASGTENLQRTDQDPIREATLYQKLLDDHATTPEDLAHEFGKTNTYIKTRLQLLQLPEQVQDYIKNGVLSIGAGIVLTRLDTPQEQLRLAIEMKGANMTITRAQTFVDSYLFYRDKMAESPEDEVIQQSLQEPEMPCPICKTRTKISDITTKTMCHTCRDNITYLIVKDKKDEKPTSSR